MLSSCWKIFKARQNFRKSLNPVSRAAPRQSSYTTGSNRRLPEPGQSRWIAYPKKMRFSSGLFCCGISRCPCMFSVRRLVPIWGAIRWFSRNTESRYILSLDFDKSGFREGIIDTVVGRYLRDFFVPISLHALNPTSMCLELLGRFLSNESRTERAVTGNRKSSLSMKNFCKTVVKTTMTYSSSSLNQSYNQKVM